MESRARRILIALALMVVLVALGAPRSAQAWRNGWVFAPPAGPWGFYSPRPYLDYRYSLPPGSPMSYYDPVSGTTSCLSPSTGLYYVCGYAPSNPPPAGPFLPAPASAVAPPGALGAGVLVFHLPPGTEVAVDGVPIGLSEGFGVVSVAPGLHQVLLQASGQQTERSLTVIPHKIFTITPTTITANEP
ncbi:MAG TPA: hypothetical protein VMG58_17155 [Candidatus Sulfotelmatobacter sp.]|nr:hypothetical protein [Candidatus Sulfotelmatobacter sp.]